VSVFKSVLSSLSLLTRREPLTFDELGGLILQEQRNKLYDEDGNFEQDFAIKQKSNRK
jgi:hypothetical protein